MIIDKPLTFIDTYGDIETALATITARVNKAKHSGIECRVPCFLLASGRSTKTSRSAIPGIFSVMTLVYQIILTFRMKQP